LSGNGSNEDDLIPVSGVADILSVSEKSVRALINRGDLPAFRPTQRGTRVRRRDVYAFLANRRVKPTTAKRKEGDHKFAKE
jgi:excisionase family DNA binding protein